MNQRVRARRATALFLALLFGVGLAVFPLERRGHGKAVASVASVAYVASVASVASSASSASSALVSGSGSGAAALPSASAPAKAVENDVPAGKGLPLLVRLAVFFLEVKGFDDAKGEAECTIDVRLRWTDLAQRYPEGGHPYKQFHGRALEGALETMWTPVVEVANRVGAPSFTAKRLRVWPSGEAELMIRTTGKLKVPVDPERFPFDRQGLPVELVVREDTADEVTLVFDNDDVAFSRVAPEVKVEGWQLGLVELKSEDLRGWDGDRYGRVIATLAADRVPTTGLAPIFIPLAASLLIPLLAVWMNRATGEGFKVEAFDLANMTIGGLFSVIALSFAIYSSWGVLAGGDNTVTRLFGLNYAALGVSLVVVVALYRFDVPRRLFGRHVHEQLFHFLSWAMPLLTFGTAIAFVLVAAQ